ncbi:MAG TPA: hypothetical protein VF218_02310 [Acidothermaceae bacterium]|jgi:hypothetical protein
MLLVGLALALGAALTTGSASVLQAVAARGHELGGVTRLVVSPLYLAGTGLDFLGFVCMIASLHWLPLFLVQCAAAASVGVTALVGRRVLGTALRHRDLLALVGLGAGLAMLASGAKAEHATAVDRVTQWLLLVAAGPVLAVGAVLLGVRRARVGTALATVAGLAFAGTGIAARMLSNAHSVADVLVAPASYALIAFGVGGMLFFASALQRTHVTIATAALFAVETLAASAVGITVLGDSTRSGFEAVTAVGFAVTLGCAITLCLSESDHATAPAGAARTATARGAEG